MNRGKGEYVWARAMITRIFCLISTVVTNLLSLLFSFLSSLSLLLLLLLLLSLSFPDSNVVSHLLYLLTWRGQRHRLISNEISLFETILFQRLYTILTSSLL